MVDTYTGNLQLLHMKPAQDGADVVYNNATNRLDAFVGFVALLDSAPPTTPPTSPQEGHAYIVPASATGDWSTFVEGDIALYNTGWIAIRPWFGLQAWDVRSMKRLRFHGGKWIDMQSANVVDLTDSTTGTPGSDLVEVDIAAGQLTDNSKINDNFASINAKLDEINLALRKYGILLPAAALVEVVDETVTVAETNVKIVTPI